MFWRAEAVSYEDFVSFVQFIQYSVMHIRIFSFLFSLLLSGGCSYHQFGAVTAGSSLGAMFGSSIGGLSGGYRGHEIGTVVGMVGGAAVGLAATSERNAAKEPVNEEEYDLDYGRYERSPKRARHGAPQQLKVEQVRFVDDNGNRRLETGERAAVVLKIYNRGNRTLYRVAPQIYCDNKRIWISPTAIVSELAPGQGFRYRAEVYASRRLKPGRARFTVKFSCGGPAVEAGTFSIVTAP